MESTGLQTDNELPGERLTLDVSSCLTPAFPPRRGTSEELKREQEKDGSSGNLSEQLLGQQWRGGEGRGRGGEKGRSEGR